MDYKTFLMPKGGCTIVECEDAIGVNEAALRFAVADGATEAFDAKSWANRLVTSWTGAYVVEVDKWLEEQGKLQHESWNGLKLSWYAEEKSALGSFAAFIGVQIEIADEKASYNATALGDSCLIHTRCGKIFSSFPLSDSNSFTSTPALAPSSSALLDKALPQVVKKTDTLERGDTLWLLSDAIAAWFLSENGNEIFSKFISLIDNSSDEMLTEFFESERQRNKIKDDDIAILRLMVNGKS